MRFLDNLYIFELVAKTQTSACQYSEQGIQKAFAICLDVQDKYESCYELALDLQHFHKYFREYPDILAMAHSLYYYNGDYTERDAMQYIENCTQWKRITLSNNRMLFYNVKELENAIQ